MNCPKCKEPMVFINTSKMNGLIGKWTCMNKECNKPNAE